MSGSSGLPGTNSPFLKDTNDNTNSPGTGVPSVPPTNPEKDPLTVPTTVYSANSPYTTPTFAYTPYTGYAGLAQQLYAALNPSLSAYTSAPRTDITDMAYAPWASLYGGPQTMPLPGSLPYTPPPPPVTNVPGGNNPPGTPPPSTPPGTTGPGAPPPTGTPSTGNHTGTGTPPPTTGTGGSPTTKMFGNHTGGFAQWMADPTGSNVGEYTNTTPTGDAPGGLLNAMRAAGYNGGAGSLLMASGLNSSNMRLNNGPMTYEQQIQGLKQGLNNRDLSGVNWKDGKWMRGGNPYISPGNTFSGWVGTPGGRKRG